VVPTHAILSESFSPQTCSAPAGNLPWAAKQGGRITGRAPAARQMLEGFSMQGGGWHAVEKHNRGLILLARSPSMLYAARSEGNWARDKSPKRPGGQIDFPTDSNLIARERSRQLK
jgi:hypothetical protein